MDRRASIENVTAEIIEACMDRDVNETSESYDDVEKTDAWAEHQKFRDQIVASPRLRSAMILLAASFRSDKFGPDNPPTVEQAVEMYRRGEVNEWHLELAISACREWFFHGWHARGGLDDAGLLNFLVHGKDRRQKS